MIWHYDDETGWHRTGHQRLADGGKTRWWAKECRGKPGWTLMRTTVHSDLSASKTEQSGFESLPAAQAAAEAAR